MISPIQNDKMHWNMLNNKKKQRKRTEYKGQQFMQ